MRLSLATHEKASAYWSGGDYKLSLSYGALHDDQWEQLIQTLWTLPPLAGPLTRRYIPGRERLRTVPPRCPPPSTRVIQRGRLVVDGAFSVGCRIQATRKRLNCISLHVPLGMFDVAAEVLADTPPLIFEPLERVYQEIALALYEIVPFEMASIGLLAACRRIADLMTDTRAWLDLLGRGNFFIRDDLLNMLGYNPDSFFPVPPDLRWIKPGR